MILHVVAAHSLKLGRTRLSVLHDVVDLARRSRLCDGWLEFVATECLHLVRSPMPPELARLAHP